MTGPIGIVANQNNVPATLQFIQRADTLGVDNAWLIMGGVVADSLSIFAAAAPQTSRITFGTAIVPIWGRHPLAMVQEVLAVCALAPKRLRVGIGPSGPGIAPVYGVQYEQPLTHMREYLTVLRTCFSKGEVDFQGRYYTARAKLNVPVPLDVPLLASALQRTSFVFCGEVSDGALSWVCPADYLCEVALPALKEGAQKAGREAPPLIAHVPVVVTASPQDAYAAVRSQIGFYPRLPHYQKMFTAAGFPEVQEGQWSDRMIEAVIVYGSVETVKQRLRDLLARGIGEIMAHPLATGENRAAALETTLETLAAVARNSAK